MVGTKQNLRTRVWWPGMDKAAERHCRACHGCQLVARPDPPEPIRSTSLPDGPWQDLAVDLMGPLPSGHSLLVIVDYYGRFYEVEVMQSTTTEKIIDRLADTFCRHGLSNTIKCPDLQENVGAAPEPSRNLRPLRTRRLPERLRDYVVNFLWGT